MNLPELGNPEKYVGLYIVDFGDNSGAGFTAEEVAELLDSEEFRHVKIYKIHKAYPDGRLEIKGVLTETFQLEMGMFFYSSDLQTARRDFKALVSLAEGAPQTRKNAFGDPKEKAVPPGRAKVHLAKYSEEKFVVALIYPAEYNDEFSCWLTEGNYKTSGPAEGGIEAVQRYYNHAAEILETRQLFGESAYKSRTGPKLLAATKMAVQR